MANTRIKVKRETLLAKLQEERDRIKAAHDKAAEKYVDDRAVFLANLSSAAASLIDKINDAVDDPEKQEAIMDRTDGRYERAVAVKFPRLTRPNVPSVASQTVKLDRMIGVLSAAEDEFISIAADDDYARYL